MSTLKARHAETSLSPRPITQEQAATPGRRRGQPQATPAGGSPDGRVTLGLALGYAILLASVELLAALTAPVLPGLAPIGYGAALGLLLLHTILCWRRPFRLLPLLLSVLPVVQLVLTVLGPAGPTGLCRHLSPVVPGLIVLLLALRRLRAVSGRLRDSRQEARGRGQDTGLAPLAGVKRPAERGAIRGQDSGVGAAPPRAEGFSLCARLGPDQQWHPGSGLSQIGRWGRRAHRLVAKRRAAAIALAVLLLAIAIGLSIALTGCLQRGMAVQVELPRQQLATQPKPLHAGLLDRRSPFSLFVVLCRGVSDHLGNTRSGLGDVPLAFPLGQTGLTAAAGVSPSPRPTSRSSPPLLVDDVDELRDPRAPWHRRGQTPAGGATPPASRTVLSSVAGAFPDCPAAGLENSYPRGVCTWYAKERRPDLPSFAGDYVYAINWLPAAERCGFPVDRRPAEGAVVVFPPGAHGAGANGHVAYVERVEGDGLLVSECNVTPNAPWTLAPQWWEAGYACAHRFIRFDRLDSGVRYIHRRGLHDSSARFSSAVQGKVVR